MTEASAAAMQMWHLHADEQGDTHFAATTSALPVRDFAPPAKPFNVSDPQPATQYLLISLPVGWVGEAHTSPKRQLLLCLTGSLRITCSTGETKIIEAGVGVLMSDVSGKGHKTEVTSAGPVNAVIIQ